MMNFESLKSLFEIRRPTTPRQERTVRQPETALADRLISQARKLDERFARLFATRASPEGVAETVRKLEVIDVLSDGVEDESPGRALAESGINVTSRKRYRAKKEGALEPEPVEGVTKAEWGEVAYTLKDGKIMKILRRALPSGMVEEELVPISRGSASERAHAEIFASRLNLRHALIHQVAVQYGIEDSEVPMNPDRRSYRDGLDIGQQTRSEITVSRIDQICGFNTVPITVLRKEKTGLVSVQELVDARQTKMKDFTDVIKLPAEDSRAKSLIRMACLDYVTKALDRHMGNIMFDKARQVFVAIDNGQAMGLAGTRRRENGELADVELDVMLSVPIELVELRPDWQLDDEALQTMKTLYNELYEHAAFVAGDFSLEDQEAIPRSIREGETSQYLSELFRFQYQHEKIAAKELQKFLERLRYLIDHRRPPPMRANLVLRFPNITSAGTKN